MNSDLLRIVFDAMPSMIFIVDQDVRIFTYNKAVENFLPMGKDYIMKHRGGEILKCIHSSESPEGCGHAPFCNNCVIRNSVNMAFQGKKIVRARAKLEIFKEGIKTEIYGLITTTPFYFEDKSLVLLVIEDISEIAELQRLIPICSICKKIKDEKETWSRIEQYFADHWDVDFSHGLCPECFEKEMSKIKSGKLKE